MTDQSEINSFLYNFLLLFFLFVDKTLSPLEKLLLLEAKYQQKIYTIINKYIDIQSSPPCRSIIIIFALYNRVLDLEREIEFLSIKEKSYIQTISNLEKELEDKNRNHNKKILEQSNDDEIVLDLSYLKQQNKLTDQDYCKIISKKDFIIDQLKKLLINNEKNEKSYKMQSKELSEKNTFINEMKRKYEKEIKTIKKEYQDFKDNYKIEFELMASAMYNLGLNYLSYRDETINQNKGLPSWVIREKKFMMEDYISKYMK